jgi:hypothetical protein
VAIKTNASPTRALTTTPITWMMALWLLIHCRIKQLCPFLLSSLSITFCL